MTTSIGGIAASIVPSSPTGAVAVAATVSVVLFVAILTFLAVAPLLSDSWTERLNAAPNGGPSIERDANDAD